MPAETRAARRKSDEATSLPNGAAVLVERKKDPEGSYVNDENSGVYAAAANAGNRGNSQATTLLPTVNKNNKRKPRHCQDDENDGKPKAKHVRVALQTVTNGQPQGKKATVPARRDVAPLGEAIATTWASSPSSGASSEPLLSVASSEALPEGEAAADPGEAPRGKDKARRATARNLAYQLGKADDIDAREAANALNVSEYAQGLYQHYRSKERCSKFYMDKRKGTQHHISEVKRTVVVDWLIEVHYKFKLHRETLYLAIHIFDEFLANSKRVPTRELQLVGVTALFLASKYEEMYIPELRDLTYICDGAYSEPMILRMEETILKTIKYNLTVPTAHHFLIRFLKAAHADNAMISLSCYILDGTLLTYEDLQCRYLPSMLAAAVVMIARRTIRRHDWSPTLLHMSEYRQEDVEPVAIAIMKAKERRAITTPTLATLEKKYSKVKYQHVAEMALPKFG